MNDEQRRRADRIFAAALDLPPAERRAHVEAACGEDRTLRELVARLLEAAETDTEDALRPGGGVAGPLWDRFAAELADAPLRSQDEAALGPGTTVGSYRVLRELGRGGMAVVYLAERVGGDFEQRVALKVLKRGLDTDEAIRRFEQERRILARAHHPHIAQLLDGGLTSDGRPFFAMEYVDGEPIDRFCDRRSLSVSDRLELFRQVVGAVGYAHRNLIVHRDLKPSNILVTADGHAKLLDFGIAKPLDEAGIARAGLTRTGMRVMTPVYASPEQVRGAPVTTASDIYQLGVLLYLLLVGRWPYRRARADGPGGAGSGDELARAICDDPPTRPSAAVDDDSLKLPGAASTAATAGTDAIVAARGTTAPRLRQRLRGDLDTIVLMALRKEPERRYGSAAQLDEDLARYLDGRPVTARPDTFSYRLAKLMARHRAAFAVAAAGLLLLLGSAVFYTVQLARERDRARLAADRASEVAAFLRGLFADAAPTQTRGEEVTARSLLDRGAARIEDELGAQPALMADLLSLMGDVYRDLALYDEARPLAERAVALARERAGEAPLELASALFTLARVREEQSALEEARAAYDEALALRRRLLGADHPDVGRALGGRGRVLRLSGDLQGALEHGRRALAILEASLGAEDAEVALALRDLAGVQIELRDFEAAEASLSRALVILERRYDTEHPAVADALLRLGDVRRFTGDREGARAAYERALPLLETVYGPEHPEVAEAHDQLGNLLKNLRRGEEALEHHRRALAIREKVLPGHPQIAASLNNLGLVHLTMREYQAARDHFARSVAAYQAALGADHVEVAVPLRNLASVLQHLGDLDQAARLLRRVLAIREAAFGSEHSLLVKPLTRLGEIELARGDPAAAEPLLRRALALGRDQPPFRTKEVHQPRIALGRCLGQLGRFEEAEALLEANLADQGLTPRSRLLTLEALAERADAAGRPAEAGQRRREIRELAARQGWDLPPPPG